jgi:GH25 family lysozyme M1 (1,4-beta-N-acetylmuramidase)
MSTRRNRPWIVLLALAACAAPEPGAEPPETEPTGAPAQEAQPGAAVIAFEPPRPLPKDPHGIDVSHQSGAVDWSAVADDGYVFACPRRSTS